MHKESRSLCKTLHTLRKVPAIVEWKMLVCKLNAKLNKKLAFRISETLKRKIFYDIAAEKATRNEERKK
jgi:hypothetical protein